MFDDFRLRRIFLLILLDEAVDRGARDLAVEFLQPAVRFTPPLRKLVKDLGQFLLQRGDHVFDALAFLLGKLVVFLRAHHAIALSGRESETRRRSQKRNGLRARMLLHRAHGLGFPVAEFGFYFVPARAVFVRFESGGNARAKVFNEALHVTAKSGPHAGRQTQNLGPMGRGEVENVAPVAGDVPGGGTFSEQAVHQMVAAKAFRTHGEKVVAVAAHADAEAQRLDGALLTHGLNAVGKVRRGFEPECGGIAAPTQFRGGQLPCHRRPLTRTGGRIHAGVTPADRHRLLFSSINSLICQLF